MVAQYPLDFRKTAEVAVLLAQIHPDQLCPGLYYLQSVFLPAPNIQGRAVKALLASSVLQTHFFFVCKIRSSNPCEQNNIRTHKSLHDHIAISETRVLVVRQWGHHIGQKKKPPSIHGGTMEENVDTRSIYTPVYRHQSTGFFTVFLMSRRGPRLLLTPFTR